MGMTTLFHLKLNADGDRFFQVMRHTGLDDRPFSVRSRLLGVDIDGGNVGELVSVEDWDCGGHHPNWIDGSTILMNLVPASGEPIRFTRIDARTGRRDILVPEVRGSGHPSFRHGMIVSDCYHHEGFADGGPLPLRLIDPATGGERMIARLDAGPANLKARRIDAHPAWSPAGGGL